MKTALARLLRDPYVLFVLKYGLGVALLAYIVFAYWDKRSDDGTQVGISAILERPVYWQGLVLAFVLSALSVFGTIWRWFILVRAQDLPFQMRDAIRLGLVGFFFNTCLPGSVGGDLIKAAFIAREQSRRTLAVATVILDRVIGFAGLYWIASLVGGGLFLSGAFDPMLADTQTRWTLEAILLASTGIAVGALVAWLLLGLFPAAYLDRMQERIHAWPKVGPPLAELIQAVRIYRQKGRFVALTLGISMVSHLGFVLSFYFAATFFTPAEQLPPIGAHLLLVPIGMTIQAGIPLPGGIGGTELAYGTLYRLSGYGFPDGVLASLGQRMVQALLGFLGYLVYLRMPAGIVAPAPAEAEASAERRTISQV